MRVGAWGCTVAIAAGSWNSSITFQTSHGLKDWSSFYLWLEMNTHNDIIAIGMCTNVFFPGEISPFLDKEIGNFLEFFFKNIVTSTNFIKILFNFAKISKSKS